MTGQAKQRGALTSTVEVMSRKAVERLIASEFPSNIAVICFYTPPSKRTPEGHKPVDYRGVCERVFPVAIHDIDIETLGDFGLTFETYFPEAEALARYIIEAVRDGYDLICQCDYGQSRSAACAAAIKEYFDGSGIEIFADYRYYPNQLIYNKLLDALQKSGGSHENISKNKLIGSDLERYFENSENH